MHKLKYIVFLGLLISCAPSGTENDSRKYHDSEKHDTTNSIGNEMYYINKAYEFGKLDKDEVGEYEIALTYIDSALQINPQSSKAYRYKAHLLLLIDKKTDALIAINKSIISDSLDIDSYLTRANVYLTIGERDKALMDYYTAFRIDSLNGRICEAIGYMEIDKGNKTTGCRFLIKARDLGYLPENRYSDSLICN